MRCFVTLLGVAAAASPVWSSAQEAAVDLRVPLEKQLAAEMPTVFVFMRSDSALERSFLKDLESAAAKLVSVRAVDLKAVPDSAAVTYAVKETPLALVYDRRGRLVKRSGDPREIQDAVKQAAGVPRIDWALEDDPRFDQVVGILGGRKPIPGILRTMSLQPEYMRYIHELSVKAHFSDGFLKRRTKELIATYVSALNKCKY